MSSAWFRRLMPNSAAANSSSSDAVKARGSLRLSFMGGLLWWVLRAIVPTDSWNASASDPHHAKGILKVIMEKMVIFCARVSAVVSQRCAPLLGAAPGLQHAVGAQGGNACSVQPQFLQYFIRVLAQRGWGVAQHGRVG